MRNDNAILYMKWKGMHFRCTPDTRYHRRYFARGIRVCDQWKGWHAFRDWAHANGFVRGLEIDRRDNDGGYSPENCRFVTKLEQNRNRDLVQAGQSIRAAWARRNRPFRCLETGEVFTAQIDVLRKHGVDRKSLRYALTGRYQHAGGLHWAYTAREFQ